MARQAPKLWELQALVDHCLGSGVQAGDGEHWYPARVMGFDTLATRARIAWRVFRGELDAVQWPGGQ